MAPSYTYSKHLRNKQLQRMAAMRAAKERKRLEDAHAAQCVGVVTFDGPLFGGHHIMRCLHVDNYSDTQLMIEIDGQPFRPLTQRGIIRAIAARINHLRKSASSADKTQRKTA